MWASENPKEKTIPEFVKASFFGRQFVKMKNIVREFVN